MARLLARRGFRTSAEAYDFLHPKLNLLTDPFALPNMSVAIDRILRALTAGERIVLYGDYDVDGVTSLTILSGLLHAYGADVNCFLPMRKEEGYGLSADGVARCVKEFNPQLLIAVDCGTASVREIASLCKQDVDVIVFDHHEPQSELPACAALVNAKLGDTYHYLCTAGLMFKVCHALLKRRPLPGYDLKNSLDLVALGTVADLVPLVEENRILVRRGALELARTRPAGAARVDGYLGGEILPRAPGGHRFPPRSPAQRRRTPRHGVGRARTADHRRRGARPRTRHPARPPEPRAPDRRTADARRCAEAAFRVVRLRAARARGHRGRRAGVASGGARHRGVAAHALATTGPRWWSDSTKRASARAADGASRDCPWSARSGNAPGLLDKFGGHEMAAGLTVQEAVFADFQRDFCRIARSLLSDEQLQPYLRLDAEISLRELDADFLGCHETLQPFGMGNPQPMFVTRGVAPVVRTARAQGKTPFQFMLRQAGTARNAGRIRYSAATPAIFFGGAQQPLPPPPWDVAFQVEANEYRGETKLQVQVQAVRAAT